MDYQFNREISRAFESADFISDDFENFGLDEVADGSWEEESYLSAAIKELDESMETIDLHQ